MAKKIKGWIQEESFEGIYIKEDNAAKTPVANIAVPVGWKTNPKWKATAERKANLITSAPQLLQFAKEIEKVGEGNAPSVGYMTDLVLMAKEVIKLAEGKK